MSDYPDPFARGLPFVTNVLATDQILMNGVSLPASVLAAALGPIAAPAPQPLPLQVVGSRGEMMAIEGGAITVANQRQEGRSRQYIGTQDIDGFRIAYAGFYVDAATGANSWTCFELNASNDCPIAASVEINGVCVPVTFGGQPQGNIVAGVERYYSDMVLPASFGLTKFDAQTLVWINSERVLPVGAKGMFHQTASNSPVIAGEAWFVAPIGTASRLAAVGARAAGGGWSQQAHVWHPTALVGIPRAPMAAFGTFGASIENGVSDGQGDGLSGAGGYMRRMLANIGGKKVARIHLAKSGETIKSFVANSAKRRVWLDMVTHVLSGHGGNDYSLGETLANTQTRWTTAWALMATGMVKHVTHYALSPKTDSSDSWATVANQTPRAGFATGGAWRDAGNAFCLAAVNANGPLKAFQNLGASQVDAAALDKWRVDLGVPTIDGTHPNGVIAAKMATDGAAFIQGLITAHEAA